MNPNLESKSGAGTTPPKGLLAAGAVQKATRTYFKTLVWEDPRPLGMIATGDDKAVKTKAVLAACRAWVKMGGSTNPYRVVDGLRELPPERYQKVLSILSGEADSLRQKFSEENKSGISQREFNRLQSMLSTAKLYDKIVTAGFDYLEANELWTNCP